MFAAAADRLSRLRARYAEPHRAYHAQAHVDALLAGLRALGGAVSGPDAVELAIWYHDAVYDPAAADNEARSADLLRGEMAGLADPDLLRRAELMVRFTADHVLPPGLPPALAEDAALFLDLDMAVLGSDAAAFDAYERGIAAEYLPVRGPERFRAGRADFLRATLARPRLFHTERFHRLHDAAARENLRRALAALSAPVVR